MSSPTANTCSTTTTTHDHEHNQKRSSSLLSSSSSSSHNYSHQLSKRGKIILMGDSITQMSHSALLSGWGSLVSDHYQRRCDVYNRGFSGYNTNWFLEYIQTNYGFHDIFGMMMMNNNGHDDDDNHNNKNYNDVKLVTIFFGANDASHPTLNPRHHVPIPQFQSNLKQIVQLCKEHYGNDIRIVFITPPPVCHKKRLQYQIDRYGSDKATGELERTLELSGNYANAVEEVAKELNYPCLNIWKDMQHEHYDQFDNDNNNNNDHNDDGEMKEHPWSVYLSDGLHLSKEGNIFVGERLIKLIENKYPDIAVIPCPITNYVGNSASKGGIGLGSNGGGGGIGPWHDEIDYLDAKASFSSTIVTSSNNDSDCNKRMKT